MINDEDLYRSFAGFQTESELQESVVESLQHCRSHVRHRIVHRGWFAADAGDTPSCAEKIPQGNLQNQLIAPHQFRHINHG